MATFVRIADWQSTDTILRLHEGESVDADVENAT